MILIFDLMDTIIEDPFYSNFFSKLSENQKKIWIHIKNHDAYILFEEGKIRENEYFKISYKKNPEIYNLPTVPKMKKLMFKNIQFLPGMYELFLKIQENKNNFNVITILASNYSIWYHEVFRKKKDLENWFDYIFFSCEMGVRKPKKEFYWIIQELLITKNLIEDNILYFDDRKENILAIQEQKLRWEGIWIENKFEASKTIIKTIQKKCPQFLNAGK